MALEITGLMEDAPSAPPRTRTFRWDDPLETAARGAALSGLDYLRAIVRGALAQPPIGMALGMRLVEVDAGRAVFECAPGEAHYNLIGTVHGGLAATLIDSASGCAVMSTLPPGDRWTTVTLAIDYLGAVHSDAGVLRCEGTVVRVGGSVGVADATVLDARGRLVARGSSTCLLRRAR
jgi:uncharacterized protein (TIGR00369 family)